MAAWRLAEPLLGLWPTDRPTVLPFHHGWLHCGNERILRKLIERFEPRVIVELGAWLGLCTAVLLEASEARGAAVVAVDRWDGEWLLEHQCDQYTRDVEALQMLRSGLNLHETFLANLWEHRTRLFPLRADALEGLAMLRAANAPVDLIYIDADHSTEAVLQHILASQEHFPNAVLVGDDWCWASVRAAVEEHVQQSSGRLRLHSHPAENWWWLEVVVAVPEAELSERPRRGAVEFVPGGCEGHGHGEHSAAHHEPPGRVARAPKRKQSSSMEHARTQSSPTRTQAPSPEPQREGPNP